MASGIMDILKTLVSWVLPPSGNSHIMSIFWSGVLLKGTLTGVRKCFLLFVLPRIFTSGVFVTVTKTIATLIITTMSTTTTATTTITTITTNATLQNQHFWQWNRSIRLFIDCGVSLAIDPKTLNRHLQT